MPILQIFEYEKLNSIIEQLCIVYLFICIDSVYVYFSFLVVAIYCVCICIYN